MEGINHYNQVFDAIKSAGIEPFVTLYHWDLPQDLQLNGGWLNETIIVSSDFLLLEFS